MSIEPRAVHGMARESMAPIEDVIECIPHWQGRSVTFMPLAGGLTNMNYRVEVDGTPYVVRIPGRNATLLAIDPAHGYRNSLEAARMGVGARVLYYVPRYSAMVLEFIRGVTLSSQALRLPGMIPRVAHTVRRLHAGPPFANTFNLFRIMDAYVVTAQRRGIVLPDDYGSARALARRIEDALEAQPLPLVPCHNDLMPENFIDEGSQLRLLDYDYSGANDPCCDLGYIVNEGEFTPEHVELLCEAYFGKVSSSMLARVWLYRCMTNVVSTLWGAIQHDVSDIAYDYWELALERWRRAQGLIALPEFGMWLHDACTLP
jgi:thiamine kinase-like enzyme